MKAQETSRWYRSLVRFLPETHRREFGEEMCLLYDDLERAQRQQGRSLLVFRLRAALDLLLTIARAWVSADLRGPRARPAWGAPGRDFVQAARALRRTPLFAAITVTTLALGIGANAALFSVAYGVLLRPLGLERADDLSVAVLHREGQPTDTSGLQPAYLRDLRTTTEASDTIERLGAYLFESGTLLQGGEAVEIPLAIHGDLAFFELLGVSPHLGRLPTRDDVVADQIAPIGLISTSLWATHFGSDPQIIGRTIDVDGRLLTVTGVLPNTAPLPQAGVDLWRLRDWDVDDRRLLNRLQLLARRTPGATPEAATAQLAQAATALSTAYPRFEDYTFTLVDFRESLVGSVRSPIVLAAAGVGLLLLIACANMANLLLARASGREREMATRRALGAQTRQVVRQVSSESALLALLGGLVGCLVALGLQRTLVTLAPPGLPRLDAVQIDLPVLAFTVLLSLLAGLLFGLAPVLHALGLDPIRSLRAGQAGPSAMRLRHTFLVVQLGLAVTLLVSAALMMQTVLALGAVDPGFQLSGVGGARLYLDDDAYDGDAAEAAYFEQLLAQLGATPGIQTVGVTSGLPLDPVTIDFDLPYRLPGQSSNDEEIVQAFIRSVSEGYFETLGMKLLEGRTFDGSERADGELVAVINAHFARQAFADGSPLGKSFSIFGGSRELRIVGVVDDVRFTGPTAATKPEFFVPFRQQTYGAMSVVARSQEGDQAAALVREAALAVDSRQPVHSVFTLEGLARGAVATERFLALLLGAFAGIALLLAGAGIYGVFSYWVNQSRWELGLRRALGASRRGIVGLVLQRSLRFAAVGLLVGLATSVATTRLLSSFLFGVAASEPRVIAAVTLLLTVTALLAAVLPAQRAAQVAPMTSLRDD